MLRTKSAPQPLLHTALNITQRPLDTDNKSNVFQEHLAYSDDKPHSLEAQEQKRMYNSLYSTTEYTVYYHFFQLCTICCKPHIFATVVKAHYLKLRLKFA
jgi:hypothetical protein